MESLNMSLTAGILWAMLIGALFGVAVTAFAVWSKTQEDKERGKHC
ncbi:MAG: hypothetical protein ACYDHY_09455 [Acidiferrobacterales bacterium]